MSGFLRESGNDNFFIYPNPVSNDLHIKIREMQNRLILTLKNDLGQTLQTLNVSKQNEIVLNMSSYPKGLYLLHLVSDKTSFVFNVIVD